ncbi:hypothetical protein OIU77_029821, partial [Salix suchowensis]
MDQRCKPHLQCSAKTLQILIQNESMSSSSFSIWLTANNTT